MKHPTRSMSDALDRLRNRLSLLSDLNAATSVLDWDQETRMPDGGSPARARQLGSLSQLAHEMLTDPITGDLLSEAVSLHPDDPLVLVTQRDRDRAVKIPAELVGALAEATGHAKLAWRKAREENDFDGFAPHLAQIVELNIAKADALGFPNRYDALIDEFEPGMSTDDVAREFESLRAELVPIVATIASRPAPDDSCLRRFYPVPRQQRFTEQAMREIGFDFNRGRQDETAHPFCTTFAIDDVRVTTRYQSHFFPSAFFGSLHETGHALYEQGIDPKLDGTPLASGTSLGLHESQSRLWENLVGRSRAYWTRQYPRLQAAFPATLAQTDAEAFYAAINRVEPSPIRVEADEVTYNLHIMLRFEMELDLIEGRLAVADVPDAWNDRMEDYLGIRPSTHADGCLQDIHWSLGILGYFPTYALGNLMSAQLFEAAHRALPDLDDQIAAGRFEPLLQWLRTNVHTHGRRRTAPEIMESTTGSALDAAPWLRHIRAKYGALYGIDL